MQADHFGGHHRFIKVAIDSVLHHLPQLFERFTLSMNSIPQRMGRVASIGLVFADLKDDLFYNDDLCADVIRSYRTLARLAGRYSS